MINQFLKILKNAKKIAIITHINPDGDAFGSALMMHEFLTVNFPHIKKQIYAETSSISEEFKLMFDNIELNAEDFDFDTVVTVDCGDLNRFERFINIFNNAKQTINIDHHKDNSHFAQLNIVNTISSNCENLFNIFKATNLKITKKIASFCYVGMLTDTLGFTTNTVDENTFRIVAEIIEFGVDCFQIRNFFFSGHSIEKYKIIATAMNKAEFYLDNKVVVVNLENADFINCGLVIGDTEGIINSLFSLKSALACFLVSPRNEKLHISMRSKPGIDVSIIANKLGGGGHVCASATDCNLTIDQIKEFLINEIEPQIKSYKETKYSF